MHSHPINSKCLSKKPDRCPCGHPFKLIGDVQGRVHQVLVFPGMAGGSVKVHPIIFHNFMDTLPVRGWQVVQETDGLHLFLADVRGTVNESELVDVVRQALIRQEAVVPFVAVQRINAIPQASSGKTPLVKSNLPHVNSRLDEDFPLTHDLRTEML